MIYERVEILQNYTRVADITYVPTWTGFVYLAVVLDVFSREVVGWSMAHHLRAELVLGALNMTLGQRRAPSQGLRCLGRDLENRVYPVVSRCISSWNSAWPGQALE